MVTDQQQSAWGHLETTELANQDGRTKEERQKKERIVICIPFPQLCPPSPKPKDAHDVLTIISKALTDIGPTNHLKSLVLLAALMATSLHPVSPRVLSPTPDCSYMGYNRPGVPRRVQDEEYQPRCKSSEISAIILLFCIILYLR